MPERGSLTLCRKREVMFSQEEDDLLQLCVEGMYNGTCFPKLLFCFQLQLLVSAEIVLQLFDPCCWRPSLQKNLLAYRRPRNEESARSYLPEMFCALLGSWTSARSGHGRPQPNACFSKVLRACLKLDVCGTSGPKTPSLALFSFLTERREWEVGSVVDGFRVLGRPPIFCAESQNSF